MLALASLVFAVVPMLLYLWIIWMMDRYDREPIGLVAANFAWGAFGAIFFAIVLSLFTSAMLGTGDFLDAILVAPLVEEPAKAVFLLFTVRSRHFDNMTDGLVYGMAIGLGFGMTENFMYFLGAASTGEWVVLVVVRTLFSAVMHALATGIVGAFFGLTKFQVRGWRVPLGMLGLGLAMLVHFFWNFTVSVNDAAAAGLGLLFIAGSTVAVVIVLLLSLSYENRVLRRELMDEAARGVIPEGHVPFLSSSSKRKIRGWVPEGVDRKRYAQLATRLAFRKSQARASTGAILGVLEEDVARLRADIGQLLAT